MKSKYIYNIFTMYIQTIYEKKALYMFKLKKKKIKK